MARATTGYRLNTPPYVTVFAGRPRPPGMVVERIACPVCSGEVAFGVPRDSTFLEVTAEPPEDDAADSGGVKYRAVACENGHAVGVRFSADRDRPSHAGAESES